jgi:hypothetical protein
MIAILSYPDARCAEVPDSMLRVKSTCASLVILTEAHEITLNDSYLHTQCKAVLLLDATVRHASYSALLLFNARQIKEVAVSNNDYCTQTAQCGRDDMHCIAA